MTVPQPLLSLAAADQVLVVARHLVIDGVSWRILLEDLQSVYAQIGRGGTVWLPLKTTSFQRWAESLTAYAQSAELKSELSFWLAQGSKPVSEIPRDRSRGENLEGTVKHFVTELNPDETRILLRAMPRMFGTQMNDVLLAALAHVLADWIGQRHCLVDVEGHGREDIVPDTDLSRTVGWLTTLFPVRLDLPRDDDRSALLRSVKAQLGAIPRRGIGYGILRYLADPDIGARLAALPQAQVSFNYLGEFDQEPDTAVFRLAPEPSGGSRGVRAARRYLLGINSVILGGRFLAEWTYSSSAHHDATIEALAQSYADALRRLIAGAESAHASQDLSDMLLDPQDLDNLLRELGDTATEL